VSFKNDFFEIAKQIEIFTGVFKTVNQNYVDETNAGEMMDIAIKNMLKELDPYTVFFNEQDVIKYKINNTGEYTGIGAMVQRKDGKVYLKEIYKGFPADKAGLKAGDELLQIGDVTLKEYQDDASLLLKGAKNTSVNIIYIRQGTTRKASIVLNEVEITGFSVMTEKEVEVFAALKDLTTQKKNCHHRSVAYRKDIMDMLDAFDEKYPGTKHAIINSFLEILPALKKKYKTDCFSDMLWVRRFYGDKLLYFGVKHFCLAIEFE
jgi:uncharacterized protein (TIGR00269 family)